MCARCPKGYDWINPTPVGATGGRPGSIREGSDLTDNPFGCIPCRVCGNVGDLPIAPTLGRNHPNRSVGIWAGASPAPTGFGLSS
ncbi:hypothetical protein [Xanthocytophaga agilis]|uniref:Uncharacterized protein n=1 Tax=Xanthocytophaga agilis TaxID=3048010 RepID=A0AAE3RDS5_9BACT|nr:hypothetical protein [Xanthocytophaga agilis]MDJ1506830.1 hypothetical protein [Xanthocytophaga agilis]